MATSSTELLPARAAGPFEHVALWRHLPLSFVATAAVTLLPLWVTHRFEGATGIDSLAVVLLLGALVSFAVSMVGARIWSSFAASDDIVFGELLLWGWIRRFVREDRLARAARLLEMGGDGWLVNSELSREEQALVLQDLAVALETRDAYTYGHTARVTRHSYAIARAMGLSREQIETIRIAATLHDVGKIDIPSYILRKPEGLTDKEFEIMKSHATRGAEMVAQLGNPEVTAIVRHHHERMDGTGYPDRLAGEQIPLGARIIAVGDTFDAICSTRTYRKAAHHKKALKIIKSEAGKQLDARAVEAFWSYYSGRNALEWKASVTTIPQRLLASFGRSAQFGAATGFAQSVAAGAAAIVIAHSPIFPGAQSQGWTPGIVTGSLPGMVAKRLLTDDVLGARNARDDESASTDGRATLADSAPGGQDGSALAVDTTSGTATSPDGVAGSFSPYESSNGSGTGHGGSSTPPSDGGMAAGGDAIGASGPTGTGAGSSSGETGGGDIGTGDTGTGDTGSGSGDNGSGGSGGGGPGGGSEPNRTTDSVDDAVRNATDAVDGGADTAGGTADGATGGSAGSDTADSVDGTTDTVDNTVDDATDAVEDATGPLGIVRR